jgi:hypothetical protein
MDASIFEWQKTLLPAIIGAGVGFLSARLQDFLVRRRRFKALASTLRAEVLRIQKELGEPRDVIEDWVGIGGGKATPNIHPWIERVVLDTADLNSELVGRFLDLDLQLHNYNVLFMALREARTRVAELCDAPEESALANQEEGAAPSEVGEERDDAENTFQMFQELAASIRKDAWRTLNRIDDLLAAYGNAPKAAQTLDRSASNLFLNLFA